jgi:hypothetical protein
MRLGKLDWPAQKEAFVETVEALPGSRVLHSWRKERARSPWSAGFAECKSQGSRTRR